MSVIKNLRELFGWSQARLASYLGVSRSLLSLAELNLRHLPPTAGTKWIAWGVFAYGKDGGLKKEKAALQLSLPDTSRLLQQADDAVWEASLLQKQLADIQQRAETALNCMALCQHLLQAVGADNEGKRERKLLERANADAQEDWKQYGAEAQAMLQWKIDSLLWSAELAKALAAELNK